MCHGSRKTKQSIPFYILLTVSCDTSFFVLSNSVILTYSIDATKESGRLGRLINHSKKPNCKVQTIKPADSHPFLVLFACRHIDAGEELTFDYGVPLPFKVCIFLR